MAKFNLNYINLFYWVATPFRFSQFNISLSLCVNFTIRVNFYQYVASCWLTADWLRIRDVTVCWKYVAHTLRMPPAVPPPHRFPSAILFAIVEMKLGMCRCLTESNRMWFLILQFLTFAFAFKLDFTRPQTSTSSLLRTADCPAYIYKCLSIYRKFRV